MRMAWPRRASLARPLLIGMTFGAALLQGCAAPPPAEQPVLAYPPPPEEPRYFFERTLVGSNDVREDSATDRLRRFATGESERGRGFSKPFDVLAVDGRIFVSDTVARHVAVLDFPRARYYEIGTEALGRLAKPLGMAADRAGHVYVVDGTAKRVQVYDLDGNYVKSIGTQEVLERPSGVAVNADGSRIYVVDTGGVESENHGVDVFDADGNLIRTIGTRGSAEGQFNLPLNAATGPDGRLYVVDAGNFRIQVFSPEGDFIRTFGEAGRFPGQLSHPKGIAVDGEGRIFIADSGFANFQIFDSEARLLLFIGDRAERGGPGEYLLPAGISVDTDGRIYLVDQFFRKVDVFRPAALPEGTPIGLTTAEPTP